ncbi:MAG: L,D-transpeptidase family protein [Actinomycetota bacterium]|nr:L,D-transpeptidase family protein [Actinomycetota bacterium]
MRRTLVDTAAIVLALALLALSLGFTWAVVDDYASRDISPSGATIAGVDLTGLTRTDARSVIASAVVAPLMEPIAVEFDGNTHAFDPTTAVRVDIDAMLDRTFRPRDDSKLADRVYRRLAKTSVELDVEVQMSIDRSAVLSWIDAVASTIDTAAVDATVTVSAGEVVVLQDRVGHTTDRSAAADALSFAMRNGTGSIELPVSSVSPTVTADELGKSIVVDLSERKLYLYDGATIEKTYGVAVGAPGHSTPVGNWVITQKRYMPTWGNPGSAWAANMPAYIPAGPSNPLGTRAINLDASGIRIHGTTQDWSIGHAASHGCIRMHRWDVEDLYERVEVSMPVFIVR